jgi:predicted RNase H-like HicB family nuclease
MAVIFMGAFYRQADPSFRQHRRRDLQCGLEVNMKFKVLFRPESVGGFSGSVPAMPGCHSQRETREEALANIREAAELWLEVTADAADTGSGSPKAELQEIEL